MTLRFQQLLRISLVCSLVFTLVSSTLLQAQSSIIRSSELRDALQKASDTRQKNLDQVASFFKSEPVREILANSPVDSGQILKGISSMDSDELAKFAASTQKIQDDFAAGSLNNEQLTYIVIALATAVIVLIIVKAA